MAPVARQLVHPWVVLICVIETVDESGSAMEGDLMEKRERERQAK